MRNYTKPHPKAIFQDNPAGFIEHWKSPFGTCKIEPVKKLSRLNYHLGQTEMYGFTTVVLFIIKPKAKP